MPNKTEQEDKAPKPSKLKATLATAVGAVSGAAAGITGVFYSVKTPLSSILDRADQIIDNAAEFNVVPTEKTISSIFTPSELAQYPKTLQSTSEVATCIVNGESVTKRIRPALQTIDNAIKESGTWLSRVPGGAPTVVAASTVTAAAAGYGIYRHVQNKKAAKAEDAQPETHAQKLAAERGYDAAQEKPDTAHSSKEAQRQSTSHETGQTR